MFIRTAARQYNTRYQEHERSMRTTQWSSVITLIGSLLFCFTIILAGLIGALSFSIHHTIIDLSAQTSFCAATPSIVIDDEGIEWARFQLDRRDPISIKNIPQHVINAFIAAEDWNFFRHPGISLKGIIRSLLVNLYHGRAVQGASTITQQLVKLILSDLQKTVSRKIKEQIVALAVEQQYTKEQILEAYLNNIYFGCGIYGVQAASQRFWAINTQDLSLEQAATLAGIVQNPSHYCPLTCPLSAQKRRNSVLYKMKLLGMISAQEYDNTSSTTLTVNEIDKSQCALHLKETIRLTLESLIGKKRLYQDGLTIKTTINKKLQHAAEQQFVTHIEQLRTSINKNIDGALISLEAHTGAIKTIIGGFNFKSSQFNRALHARRQMGSTIKPLVYTAGLQQGIGFQTVAIDEPLTLQLSNTTWSPKNYDRSFYGPMSLAHALSTSSNIIATKLLLHIGAQPVIDLAQKAGLKGPFHTYPSLALGCIDATIKEVAGMFNIFANNGTFVEPYFIDCVKDRWGKKLYKHQPVQKKVIEAIISDQVACVLQLSTSRLRKLARIELKNWPNCEVICKTGTTNESRTCWFVGSTPQLTTAVYVGNDDNSSLGKNVFPVKTAFPLWVKVNQLVAPQKTRFTYDPSLYEIWIDRWTGQHVAPEIRGGIPILVKG